LPHTAAAGVGSGLAGAELNVDNLRCAWIQCGS
jgi:hypothetical protein